MENSSFFSQLMSWGFGIGVVAAGIINTFWGNDQGFGIFLLLLSLVYFPPVTAAFTKRTGIKIAGITKVTLGVFIFWAALGVGEIFNKIDLMMADLNN